MQYIVSCCIQKCIHAWSCIMYICLCMCMSAKTCRSQKNHCTPSNDLFQAVAVGPALVGYWATPCDSGNAPRGRVAYLCWKQGFLKLPHVHTCSFHKQKIVKRLPVDSGYSWVAPIWIHCNQKAYQLQANQHVCSNRVPTASMSSRLFFGTFCR